MKHALFALLAAGTMAAQDRPTMPSLAERGWFKAEPLFTAAALEADRLPAERSWKSGPAFAIDSPTAPAVSGRAWHLSSKLRFNVETAAYTPAPYRWTPTRDTAVAARFEFRF